MDDRIQSRVARWLEDRMDAGLERSTVCRDPSDTSINLANNDYFRLAQDPRLKEAAKEAIERFGCSASASPLVTGFTLAHERLLSELLEWHGRSSGMLWNSGYAANHAVLGSLPGTEDWILADRLAHNSMLSGALKSQARLRRFPHNDVGRLKSLLAEGVDKGKGIVVATESIYSMDGDKGDLESIASLKDKYPFIWLLDEAHALTWYGDRGEGLASELGVADKVDILLGTLGKGLGSMGAYTVFNDETYTRYFTNACGEYIYSTFFAPGAAAAASEAITIIGSPEAAEKRKRARAISREFRDQCRRLGLEVPEGDSPVVPIVLGEVERAVKAQAACQAAGVQVVAIRPPTVPKGTSRLRISLNVSLEMSDLDPLLAVLREEI